MSKAEENALVAYPKREATLYGPLPTSEPSMVDNNLKYRTGYIQGYRQAEKDLELTWEDIKTIDKLLNQCVDCNNPYQEVLKRYKETKK